MELGGRRSIIKQLPVLPVYQVFGKSKREGASVPAFK
eukprot:COSAG01_NODE_64613_length_274_cov_0.531073_1_plen_36_part_01